MTTKPWWRDSVLVFGQVTAWIAIPIVLALFIGKYLDGKYSTSPWIFLISIALAFLVTVLGIWKVIKNYMKSVKTEESLKNNGNGNTGNTK